MNTIISIGRAGLFAALLATSGLAAAQSARSVDAPPPAPPAPVATMPATPAPDMQAVLDAMMARGAKPIETLTPAMARMQPTAADGMRDVLLKQGKDALPDMTVTTQDLRYGSELQQYARVYRPAMTAANAGAMPVVVYYHGGGWVIADVNVYDATPRLLAKQLGAVVVSVEYRPAPEAKFPAQHDDAAMAYRWVLDNAASGGGDPKRVALAGESAGGNLAVATAIYARDNGLTMPLHILAVYPIANSSKTLPSRMDSFNAKPLDTPMLDWFAYYYQTTGSEMMDPRINLVGANLRGLPPTTIINAQIDPLRSDGETLADAMKGAGDRVEQRTFPGVTHEFFGLGQVVRGAYDANLYAVERLRDGLRK